MARPLRIHVPGGFYHVTLRGNHQQEIFRVDSDRHLLNAIVRTAIEKHAARLHAYCWMTNHLHFLWQVGLEPLSSIMRDIASGYARTYQRNLATTGHLFERRYHARLVDVDAYLFTLLHYIHWNPVEAGLAISLDAYRWSSHHAYAGRRADPLVTTDFALRMFADETEVARSRYLAFIGCSAESRATDSASQQILGDADFVCRALKAPAAHVVARVTLEDIIAEVCSELAIDRASLRTSRRHHSIARMRALIASRALDRAGVTLSEVARELGCDRKTLRVSMRRYAVKDKG